MRLLVLSDLHLSSNSVERTRSFLKFLEEAWKAGDEVLIAGDLFDLWFGWSNLSFEFQIPVISKMKKLAGDGLVMDYVEGNRDFGISRYEGVLFRHVWTTGFDREWLGKSLHVEHGDLINHKDLPYRFWRSLTKNFISFWLMRHVPSFLMLRLASRLEKDLRGTNKKHKKDYPEEICQRFSLLQLQQGKDVVIVGHFHREKEIQFHQDNKSVLFYNLPGWENGFRYLTIPPGNQKPYFTEWGSYNGNSATA